MFDISVALATYNGEKYIAEQLASLAAQTLPPAELIVCDDGSEDRTLELVEAFAKTARFPVHIHRNERRLGYRANFMKAAGLCSGDLIAFCDQDDVWDQRKLEIVSVQFDRPDVLLVYHNAWIADADLKPIKALFSPRAAKKLKRGLLPSPWFHAPGHSIVFRQGLALTSDLWKISVDPNEPTSVEGHDQWIFFLASILGIVAYIDSPLVQYRQHDRNTYRLRVNPTLFASLRPSAVMTYLTHLAFAAKRYRNLQEIAENKVELLMTLRDGLEATAANRVTKAIRRHRELAERLALRAELYRSPRLKDRIRIISEIVRRGGYGANYRWSFKKAALLKDVVIVLPFGSGASRLLNDETQTGC